MPGRGEVDTIMGAFINFVTFAARAGSEGRIFTNVHGREGIAAGAVRPSANPTEADDMKEPDRGMA
jgi:hypothetical protein